jgi:hypothetical protein
MSVYHHLDDCAGIYKDKPCTLCGQIELNIFLVYRGEGHLIICEKCCEEWGQGLMLDIIQLQATTMMRKIAPTYDIVLKREYRMMEKYKKQIDGVTELKTKRGGIHD